jgi:hypothetical protein
MTVTRDCAAPAVTDWRQCRLVRLAMPPERRSAPVDATNFWLGIEK